MEYKNKSVIFIYYIVDYIIVNIIDYMVGLLVDKIKEMLKDRGFYSLQDILSKINTPEKVALRGYLMCLKDLGIIKGEMKGRTMIYSMKKELKNEKTN